MNAEYVRSLEERRWSAMLGADAASLRDLLADDLVFVHSSGRVDSKETFVADVASGAARYVSLDRSQERIRVFGDTALVHGNATVRVQAGANERERRMQYLAVWRDDAAGPRLVAWQASPLPAEA